MGRIKSSLYYEKQADEAKAREAYYRTVRVPVVRPVTQRATTRAFYRSSTLKRGTDSIILEMLADSEAAAKIGGIGAAGLLATRPAGTTDVVLPRPQGFQPNRANWYSGTATPQQEVTPYGTKWTRYYDAGDGAARSHFSIPLSVVAGEVTVAGIQTAFNALFVNADGSGKTALLGAKNGRANLTFEKSRGGSILT